jgi:hypothetical protein
MCLTVSSKVKIRPSWKWLGPFFQRKAKVMEDSADSALTHCALDECAHFLYIEELLRVWKEIWKLSAHVLWFQASTAMLMRSVLFWGVMQHRVVILCHFGTTYQSHPQGSRSAMMSFDFMTLEDRTHMLSRNIGKGLPLDTALTPQQSADLFSSWSSLGLSSLIHFKRGI